MMQTKTKTTREKAASHSAASASASPQNDWGTITSAVAADPHLPPSKAEKRLFPSPPAWKRAILRYKIKEELQEGRGKKWNWHKGAVHDTNAEPDDEELQRVRERYGYKSEQEGGPSRLYTMILADCCLPLPRHPTSGVVSPALLATTGIAPFSIFSTGPDIIQHYYDCMISAKREVILLTNYWQNGKNVDKISDALRDLNKIHEQRIIEQRNAETEGEATDGTNGLSNEEKKKKPAKPTSLSEQIVVKIMWDRGPQTLADLFRLRKPVPPGMWKTNGLPTEDEVPFLNIEILNYHRPLMGTFHAKLLLVDRQVALVNSNNIQDRPNIESCVRLEGDIVNSVYDHALISWGNALNPPLPCLSAPAPKVPSPAAFSTEGGSTLPVLTAGKLREIASVARKRLQQDDEETEDLEDQPREAFFGPQRRLSLAEVIDGVMRREHPGGSTPASPAMPSSPPKEKELSPAEKDRAARMAGVEWARKVLGERFGGPSPGTSTPDAATAASPGSPATATASPGHDASSSPPQSKRHFADIVHALMEKEGIKPALWAEGALDTFGLGQSSSRNVADEAKRSREAAKMSKVHVPPAVAEESGPSDVATKTEEAEAKQAHSSFHATHSPSLTAASEDGGPTSSESTKTETVAASAAPTGQTSAEGYQPTAPKSDADEEGAPGAQAYQQRLQTTMSNLSKASATERLAQITKSLDFANLSQVKGEITAEQLSAMDELAPPHVAARAESSTDVLQFNPFIFHSRHEPAPMALVNRRPHGTPGHSDIRNPQDAAWLAGFRYAKKHIFLQSPTLNATPIKHAILHAARRHVRIEAFLGLGFNDKSESMPFQGGTNEQVVTRLYRQLRREGKGDEKYLEVYWYTGKDMTRPLNAVRKQRNCHVKYISFDGQVAITGSGNMDTQSWFHSQEINVMVDSAQIVAEWDEGLRRNQSTGLYGRVDDDGIWRGKSGSERVDKGGDQ